jgi:hypothetical protein
MKDIQKIKEFFSQPVKESLTRGYSYQETSGEDFKKITITEPIDDATKDKMIKNFRAAGWDAKPNNGGGITAIKKAMMEAKKETEGVWNKKAIEDFFTFLETIGIKVTYLKFTNTKGTNGEVDMKINRDKYLANFHVNYSNNTYYLVLIRTIDSDLASEDLDIFLQKKKAGKKVKYDSFSTGNAAIISFKEEEETAVDMAKNQLDALGVKYEMSGNKFKPFEAIYRPNNKSNEFYDEFNRIVYEFNLGSAVKQSKSIDEAKFMSGMLSGKEFINAKLQNYPKAVAKVNQLIDMIGESKFTIEMAEWIFDFFNNAHFESPMNEASKEEETKFHKNLDTLVHNTFGKRKGELEEAVNLKQSKLSSAEYQKAKKLKDFKSSDWKWNADEDLYIKVVKEATDYMKRRQAQNDYPTSKEDKPKKPTTSNPSGNTDYMKRRKKELAETILAKLKN